MRSTPLFKAAALLILSTISSIQAQPTDLKSRATNSTAGAPVVRQAMPADFADPAFILDNNTFWGFSSQSRPNGRDWINVQVAKSPTVDNGWRIQAGFDALPTTNLGAWVNKTLPCVWAPDVIRNDAGQYVMYYSAVTLRNYSKHCVGAALSDNIQGPYQAQDRPLYCDIGRGGAIDASGFQDTDGTRYVLYKIDGNTNGHGGTCDNTVAPIAPTPIMLQKVRGDGFTPIGSAVQILDREDRDGPLIEAPSLVHVDGLYVLFFSSNCFSTPLYDISYATATSIAGPYTKSDRPFAQTGWVGTRAPGGATVGHWGRHLLFHEGVYGQRTMWVASITIDARARRVSVDTQ